MEKIAILGSRTLLGEHLVKTFDEMLPDVKKFLWDYATDGLASLDTVLTGCDVMFNLHELQDFSVVPDGGKIEEHNVSFVEHLLSRCKELGCTRLVHLSTVFLQCSSKWPNVHGREAEEFTLYQDECPFPEYCRSKHAAEQRIRNAAPDIRSIIARIGPLYGEGDRRSLVCDSILITNLIGSFPLIGDQGGVLQFTYAGNAAHALLTCAQKFFPPTKMMKSVADDLGNGQMIYGFNGNELKTPRYLSSIVEMAEEVNTADGKKKVKKEEEEKKSEEETGGGIFSEMVLISDATPVKDIYGLLLEPMAETEENVGGAATTEETAMEKNIRIGRIRVPFYVFYTVYWLLAMFVSLLGRVFDLRTILSKMPSPQYIYIVFRHWTFFSDYKLRLFFDCMPRFDWATSLRRSRAYYSQLKPQQIEGFSWAPPN